MAMLVGLFLIAIAPGAGLMAVGWFFAQATANMAFAAVLGGTMLLLFMVPADLGAILTMFIRGVKKRGRARRRVIVER